MRLKLWKYLLLSLLLPSALALSITLYAVYDLGKISYGVSLIEIADDIQLTLLELRRYEKNLLLFSEESNLRLFQGYLEKIDQSLAERREEMLAVLSPEEYRSLVADHTAYKQASAGVAAAMRREKSLVEEIRPLGRDVERLARNKEQALELRRFEKNFIIYREGGAVQKVHRLARMMAEEQPALEAALERYLLGFDELFTNELDKARQVQRAREAGRGIERYTQEFSDRERASIVRTISASKRLFIAAFVLLLSSILSIGYLVSSRVLTSLKAIEQSFKSMGAGDFSHDVELSAGNLPEEVRLFVEAYNSMMHRLGASRDELRHTLDRLAEANAELLDRQDELVEARKISAMRLLAAEIAHEVNNPLSSVGIFLGTFYDEMADEDWRKADTLLMVNEVRRCQTVLRELVDFARREPLTLTAVSPAQLVREAIEAVKFQFDKPDTVLTTGLDELPAKVSLDAVLVYQAFVNLIANAFQFSPPEGTVEVSATHDEETFTIAVADHGIGIPPENLAHIFRPFFTTRKELGGSGLGLAITKKIIERHGGRMTVASTPGAGTVFTVTLPRRLRGADGASTGD